MTLEATKMLQGFSCVTQPFSALTPPSSSTSRRRPSGVSNSPGASGTGGGSSAGGAGARIVAAERASADTAAGRFAGLPSFGGEAADGVGEAGAFCTGGLPEPVKAGEERARGEGEASEPKREEVEMAGEETIDPLPSADVAAVVAGGASPSVGLGATRSCGSHEMRPL